MVRSIGDRWRVFLVLAVMTGFLLGSSLVILNNLRLTVDLAFFLPEPQTLEQELLTERLGQGPGSRLMFITLADKTDPDAVAAVHEALLASGHFTFVSDGSPQLSVADIPAAVWQNRYLLTDVGLEIGALEQALRNRLGDLAAFSDADAVQLIAADPTLASVQVLEKLGGPLAANSPAFLMLDDKSVHLLAETIAPAFAAESQQKVVKQVREIVLANTGEQPELHGAGVYTAELQASVRADASYRSAIATLAVVVILLVLYRRWLVVPLSLLPVLMGGVAGMLVLTFAQGQIHGITLAFGFTLLGVAIDYPLHLLSHARRVAAQPALRAIWPTLRLGGLTTVIAYVALAFGGSKGLAQLGLFSAVGVLVALATVRWAMPLLISVSGYSAAQPSAHSGSNPADAATPNVTAYSHVAWLSVLLAAIFLGAFARPALWESDLAALMPVAKERLQRDRELRVAMGAPEMGYLIAVTGDSYENVLERTEQLEPLIARARDQGILAGATLATTLLPSEKMQRQRIAYLRNISNLQERLRSAAVNMPFNDAAFDPFIADIARVSNQRQWVNQATWKNTQFAELTTFGVYADDGKWVSQSLLYQLTDLQRMQELLAASPEVSLIDLRAASMALVNSYRQRILVILAITAVLAVCLLWWRIGPGRRLLWVTGSILAALSLTISLKIWLFGGLSLFALMACVLVAGLGLDYGLFCSRIGESAEGTVDTNHAVRACALSTFAAFAVLALSPIPVLQDIGFTVAAGVGCTYLLMLLGRGRNLGDSG